MEPIISFRDFSFQYRAQKEPTVRHINLDIRPGAVSVMGLMNDHENHVQLLVDEDVMKGEYLGCHPCVNTSSMKVRTEDIFGKFLEAVHHDMIKVTLTGE